MQNNNSRRFLFCQETSQLTSTRLLSFVTGRGESKLCSREKVLLWKIILQNILVHTRIIKIQMLNCYCQLSSSVIFRQYGVSQSECKSDRPRPGLPRVSPRPHTEAMGTRLLRPLCVDFKIVQTVHTSIDYLYIHTWLSHTQYQFYCQRVIGCKNKIFVFFCLNII
jgi:hypothetical protein